MPALLNLTPFAAAVHPHADAQGRRQRLLIVKGVWELDQADRLADRPGGLGLRESALMVRMGDLALEPAQRAALGEGLDEEIEWLPSDFIPPKPRFDLIVSGYACAAAGKAAHQFMAAVVRGKQVVGLRLCAPRFWRKTLLSGDGVPGHYLSTVHRVPVHPRFSYGGQSAGGETPYQPQGMGSPADCRDKRIERIALPWVEHPDYPVTSITCQPLPAGFGPWPENAGHRLPHMGTRDARWQRQRAPRLPEDFHPLFHNQAETRLQWSDAPMAGETVALHQFTSNGLARIIWPGVRPLVSLGSQALRPLAADTCIVSPEEGRYAVVWRGLLPPDGAITLHAHSA